ncbi:MAG: N-acetyltransferase [Mesorhizobium sp.]|nr:MAG: N-acetyltransferase [Mesorhizobium sp.]RWN28321.1 MAG: N-acetyltransferase [Mesorhizobium sp.]RWO24918.1 MAG: N-acetyltransferase [Mesorhizobium sp.]
MTRPSPIQCLIAPISAEAPRRFTMRNCHCPKYSGTRRLHSCQEYSMKYRLRAVSATMQARRDLLGHWRPSDTIESLVLDGHDIIELDGKGVGCIAVTWQPDHLFLEKQRSRNRGMGAQVLQQQGRRGAQRGHPTRLSVLTTNPASKFYEREGFVVETETAERRRMVKFLPLAE